MKRVCLLFSESLPGKFLTFIMSSIDPFLSGTLASSWIEGVHSRKVIVTPKHFVGNEQEFQRRSNNSKFFLAHAAFQ